jgi:hypothetical protein
MSFDALKQNRASAISKLVQAAEKVGGNAKSYGDDRYWAPQVDKSGNGFAVIRFLPTKEGDDLPWARFWDHGFKGPTGRWYIESSLTSIGQPDPVSEINTRLWNSGNDSDKEIARERKRRLHYVSNILVISDPANPANEGKVFLYKFGKKIFDKVMDLMQPQFQDETPVNPFDFWEGANFKLKIRNFDGYRNYDKSEFDPKSALFGGDEGRLRDVYDSLHTLKDFSDPKNYKTYEELKRKLIEVLGEEEVNGYRSMAQAPSISEPTSHSLHRTESAPAFESKEADESPFKTDSDEDDDSLSYFSRLAQS